MRCKMAKMELTVDTGANPVTSILPRGRGYLVMFTGLRVRPRGGFESSPPFAVSTTQLKGGCMKEFIAIGLSIVFLLGSILAWVLRGAIVTVALVLIFGISFNVGSILGSSLLLVMLSELANTEPPPMYLVQKSSNKIDVDI